MLTKRSKLTSVAISEEELSEIRKGLHEKWRDINHQYQMLTHRRIYNSDNEKLRKERLEKILDQLENDIKLISKNNILVHLQAKPVCQLLTPSIDAFTQQGERKIL